MNRHSGWVFDVEEGDGSGRGRQLVAAMILLLALVGIGLWLSGTLRSASSIQDCVASGRSNCAPIR